ncbi:MAG TPA: DinB family protein [Acidobacteriaceae bacterium]
MIQSKKKKAAAIPPYRSLGGELRKQLKALLEGGQAHATFEKAVEGLPVKLRGEVPEGLPYSAWQLLEHIRIAQRDILDFSRNADGSYKAPKWPEGYWPKKAAPPSAEAWDASVRKVQEDRAAFVEVLESVDNANLVKPFAWGDGQNLLREALLIADHEAYHVGEMIVLRRVLGAWEG